MCSKSLINCVVAALLPVLSWVNICTSRTDSQTGVLGRADLLAAVQKVKNDPNDREDLRRIISFFDAHKDVFGHLDLFSDYVSYLKDDDGQVQLLGARGLYELKNPKGIKALSDFLRSKDFIVLKKKAYAGELDSRQYKWEIRASIETILALGKIGDDSVVPLLESLRTTTEFQLEWGGGPVEKALAELGSIKSLWSISQNARDKEIWNAASAVVGIRDATKVPELMATAVKDDIAQPVRQAALRALAEINSSDVPSFLVAVMNDAEYDLLLRGSAAVAAGRTKAKSIEEHLLAHSRNVESDIRAHAFVGLIMAMPDKYLDSWFDKLMDPNEDSAFRNKLAGLEYYIPRDVLISRREQLYKCLTAADTTGRPLDKVRLQIWCRINELYREEPQLILTTASADMTLHLRHPIRNKIMMANPHLSFQELKERVDERIKSIVQVYEPQPQEEK